MTPSKETLELIRKSFPHISVEDYGFLRYNTPDREPKEQFSYICDLQDQLKEYGCYLENSDSDHDTIWGNINLIKE